ncbi:hypothetical protein TKK_0015298 [Trichogramma kaykai]
MGADFVLLNRVEIDFGSKKLTIQDKSFKLFFEDQPLLKRSKTTLANYRQPYISKLMPYIKINLYVYQAMLLLDTGAQISVIYQRVIPKGLNINSTKKLTVEDINGRLKETLGKVTIMLCEIPTIFHVVDETFDLPGDGILGVNFFHLNAPRKRGRPPKNLQKPKPDIPSRNPSKRIIKPPEKFDPSNYIKPLKPDPKLFEIPPSESEKSDDSDSVRESTDDEEQQSNEA